MSPGVCRNCDDFPAISKKHDGLVERFSIACYRCLTIVEASDYETALDIWNGDPRFERSMN